MNLLLLHIAHFHSIDCIDCSHMIHYHVIASFAASSRHDFKTLTFITIFMLFSKILTRSLYHCLQIDLDDDIPIGADDDDDIEEVTIIENVSLCPGSCNGLFSNQIYYCRSPF